VTRSGQTVYTSRPGAQRGVEYLRDRRKVAPERAAAYGVRYCGFGRHENQLIFPVFMFGHQVYFTTRYCGDSARKSDNPPNLEGYYAKGDVLLNFDAVLGQPVVFIAEGPISAMAFEHAVALMGKKATPMQVDLLGHLAEHGTRELVVALDADAREEAIALWRALQGRGADVSLLFLPSGDPDDNRGPALAQAVGGRRAPTTADRVRLKVEKCLTVRRRP
jgi:hypothetical protein